MSFNPRRLSLARRRRGLSKKELAAAAGVSERSITAYEGGETVPSDITVALLARALEFPPIFFSRPDPAALRDESVSFRSLSRMTAAQRDSALAGGELALELTNWIDAHFELPAPDLPDLRESGDPEAAAQALRTRWLLGDKPISNMVRLLEAKGVRVFSLAERCQEVDAFSFWREERPFVFLNTVKSSERSRFDAAHELGHLLLHRHGQPSGRQAEHEADLFASAFLMPRSSMVAYAPRTPTVERLIKAKHDWNVSLPAYAYGLRRSGMLTEWQYRTICVEIQKRGYRKAEPESGPREMSLIFEKVFASLRTDGLTRADVARELGWPVRELNALVFGLAMTAATGGGKDQGGGRLASDRERLQLVN